MTVGTRQSVTIDNGFIVIEQPASTQYEIPLSKCQSYESILSWVLHLDEKSWITREVLTEFTKQALNASDLPHPQH